MTRNQYRILAIGVFLLGIVALFPARRYDRTQDFLGGPSRGFVFNDVRVENAHRSGTLVMRAAVIDWERLALEEMAIVGATGAILLWSKSSGKAAKAI